MSGVTGLRYTFARHNEGGTQIHESSPLFERIGNDDFAELQQFRTTIDALQERIADLERINVDLEYRLEDQARQCMDIEKECMAIKREWASKCDLLQTEIEHWKLEHQNEQTKSTKLREQNSRTERELYRILQRKYELMRGNVAQNKSMHSLNEAEKESLQAEEKPQPLVPHQKKLFANLQGFFGY